MTHIMIIALQKYGSRTITESRYSSKMGEKTDNIVLLWHCTLTKNLISFSRFNHNSAAECGDSKCYNNSPGGDTFAERGRYYSYIHVLQFNFVFLYVCKIEYPFDMLAWPCDLLKHMPLLCNAVSVRRRSRRTFSTHTLRFFDDVSTTSWFTFSIPT